MDIFVEQLIQKEKGAKDILIILGGLIASIVLNFVILLYLPVLLMFTIIGCCAGIYFLLISRNLEYEYCIVNGDISIDKIKNKAKRKRLLSVDAHEIEQFGKFTPEILRKSGQCTHIFATTAKNADGNMYFLAHHKTRGTILVVFNPSEAVLNAIKPFMNRQVARDAFGRI